MLRLILLVSLLVLPAICCAEVFKWVNEKGVVGFADDLGNVPQKYRAKAVPVDKIEQAVEVVEEAEVKKGGRSKNEARQQQSPSVDKETEKVEPLFGGKNGNVWKKDFARQKYEIANLEEQAAGMKGRMANPGKMTRSEYLMLQNSARDFEVRISVARKKLDALNEAADRVELPADFR